MPTFSIIHLGVYRAPEKRVETLATPSVALLVSGIAYRQVRWPDGRQVLWRNPSPRFCIETPGCEISFECTAQRENWAVQLGTSDLRFNRQEHRLELRDGQSWYPLPHYAEVAPERLPYWRSHLERMKQNCASSTPQDRLWAQLGVVEILRYVLERRVPPAAASPAARLKQLIDEDQAHLHTMAQLSAACGYSTAQLRVLFRREYHLSPQVYRTRRRMARVMELVVNSSKSAKQIARETNFRYVSHLSASFRKAYRMTLSEAIRRHRRVEA